MAEQNLQKVNEPPKPNEPMTDTKAPDEPFLGTWKSKEAAEEGLANLQKVLDSQGNELGTLRKQTEFFQKQMEQMNAKPKETPKEAPKGPDYAQEMKAVQKQLAELDPDEPGYQDKQTKLVMQSNQIAAQQATEQALTAAQAEIKKALDERDVQTMQNSFYEQNPDFNTPEMQMRIQEYLNNDKTGMSDPMVAYREIQRDEAMAAKAQLEEETAELRRLLNLKKGEDATGKVVTKGQSPQQKTKQPKATGADLDRGMMEALRKAEAV